MKKLSQKQAFTLIELLIASTIFAIAVVISVGVFGSGANMQANTKASIGNQEFSSVVNDKIFDDLKSATSWGKVQAIYDTDGVNKNYKIKGIAFMQLSAGNIRFLKSVDESTGSANLIIGFRGAQNATIPIVYYFESGKIFRKELVAKDYTNSATVIKVADFAGINDPANQLKTDNTKIKKFTISGQNYISQPSDGTSEFDQVFSPINRYQPLINLDLTVVNQTPAGVEGNSYFETLQSISSRNYLEEIK